MSLTVREVLLAAAETCERGWCRGSFALDETGDCVCSSSSVAVAWCVRGAIHRNAPTFALCDAAIDSFQQHLDSAGLGHAMEWNDQSGRTQAEVVAALRAAAEAQP
jgi:hypothetical protein